MASRRADLFTRVRDSVGFPLAVFAVWRISQLLLTIAFGGDAVESAFQWDGHYYARIFEHGYHLNPGEGNHATAFFPGIAWAARAVGFVAPTDRVAQLAALNLAAATAFVTVWGVGRAWRGPEIARRAVVILALFPSSLFLAAFYSEGAFIALGAGAVWADRKHRPWLSALLLFAVSTTRTIGMMVGLVLVVSRCWRQRRVDHVAVVYAAATAIGVGLVMGAMWSDMGDPLTWISAQRHWGRELSVPVTWITHGVRAIANRARPQQILDLFSVGAGIGTIIYAWTIRRDRWPLEARLLPIAFLIVPLCTPTPESSFNRFILGAWPCFIIGAEIIGRAPRWTRVIIYAGAAATSVVFVRFWAHGKFLG